MLNGWLQISSIATSSSDLSYHSSDVSFHFFLHSNRIFVLYCMLLSVKYVHRTALVFFLFTTYSGIGHTSLASSELMNMLKCHSILYIHNNHTRLRKCGNGGRLLRGVRLDPLHKRSTRLGGGHRHALRAAMATCNKFSTKGNTI